MLDPNQGKQEERQRDRETERQRDRETERQRDRETERCCWGFGFLGLSVQVLLTMITKRVQPYVLLMFLFLIWGLS